MSQEYFFEEHFKKNLHHAYLFEGEANKLIPQLKKVLIKLGFNIESNPDIYYLELDTIKINDAKEIKSLAMQKNISDLPRMFFISINQILPEAQNTLLKTFEEPIKNTTFFLFTPNVQNLIQTLISRFYFIGNQDKEQTEIKEIENFIQMNLKDRLNFIKDELLLEEDFKKVRALKFINKLEFVLEKKITNPKIFEQIFKVREYLLQPGASLKTLLESIALSI